MAEMKEQDKFKWIDNWNQNIIEVGKIKSQSQQATELVKLLGAIMGDIWQDGYGAGKKAWAEEMDKN